MKTIGYLLGVALALCPLTLKADTWATWTDENGVEWRYATSNGEATIGQYTSTSGYHTAVPSNTEGDITVPEMLGGYPVTVLANYAFNNCQLLTKITLPPTIRHIGQWAFSGCSSLQYLEIPDGVSFLQEFTFGSYKNLHLVIPKSVTSIMSGTLYGVPHVTLAEGSTHFSAQWFYKSSFDPKYSVIYNLHLPASLATVDVPKPSSSMTKPVTVHNLYIHGEYRNFYQLFEYSDRLYYDVAYADEWKSNLDNRTCQGSRLSVVSTLHGGTTSERGRYVAWGEEVSVTAAAKEGYVFLGWGSDREGIEGTEETITFTMPQAPVTLVANFFPKALLEGWMDTRIDAKVDGERLMTADQAAEKTAAAIEGKVESGELFTPAGAEAKAAEEIAQKVANKELITADSLQEMALDAPVIEVDASGTAKVGISLQKASSLSGDWEEVALGEDAASVSAGTLKLAVPAEEGTAFYKFVVPARQGTQEP